MIISILIFILVAILSFFAGYKLAIDIAKHDLVELLPVTNREKDLIRRKL